MAIEPISPTSPSLPDGKRLEYALELQDLDRVREDEKLGVSTVTDALLGDDQREQPSAHPSAKATTSTGLHPSTHPLFPPLPVYRAPSFLSSLQCLAIRGVSFILSLLFLGVIVGGALINRAGGALRNGYLRVRGQDPNAQRKFYSEERIRKRDRQADHRRWTRQQKKKEEVDEEGHGPAPDECPPLEGGRDPIVSDVAYYARRVGLDVETFKVQTEDGYILTLWHVYNPQEQNPSSVADRQCRGPQVFTGQKNPRPVTRADGRRKYPVLLLHGLLQSAGAYCTNDDDSLAFYLCKSGYDVWLANNRCALKPEHTTLSSSDPRMWAWNIRQMGVFDIAAHMSRVLYETGFEKLGLVCHSQGTTETLIALAKDQRPELGERISVFCALAPAAYAGPLVDRVYFRIVRALSPRLFRLVFGIHSFIPFMMTMHARLQPRVYGTLGYYVFSHLFGWSDTNWDRGLRDRMFQFAPVYVSTETIRWWLGRDSFSIQKCILATRETCLLEMEEDSRAEQGLDQDSHIRTDTAWYGPQAPPMALWVGGSDDLVDGRRLLRRLQNGREPHVQVVHAKVIEEYEHLDVLWAMDVVDQVGKEICQVLWNTMPEDVRGFCRAPRGV
ncbi:hypothetical protein N8T08_008164 [Aspergillus melleus]|uniref:Uncharacterized protein n=1 Tax=Aspergillus melleus TaxID=138277 RepID=A0ACC3AWY0_9EURO|nr:hypothetical protein N8T08_008164 [Aspergillus melleus]